MSTETLFGETRRLVGPADQEWSVWVSGLDDIHDKDTLADALELANELNASLAALRETANECDPVTYALVLHHGYAWTVATEHALGLDCGHPDCYPCATGRSTKWAI